MLVFFQIKCSSIVCFSAISSYIFGGKITFQVSDGCTKIRSPAVQNLRGFSARASRQKFLGISGHKNLSDSEMEGLLYFISPAFINMKHIATVFFRVFFWCLYIEKPIFH